MFESTDEVFQEAIKENMDLQNLIDMGLFIEIICGGDNTYKNQFIGAVLEDEDYQFIKIPWDFDLTWGNRWDGSSSLNSSFDMKRTEKYFLDTVFEKIVQLGVYDEKIQDRWAEIRTDIYNLDYIDEKLNSYVKLLEDSGAYEREAKRWPDSQVTMDVSPIREFAQKRLDILDKRYGFVQ